MSPLLILQRFLSRHRSLRILCVGALIGGLIATARLAAQQAEADNPHPAVAATAAITPPASDAEIQTPVQPGQSEAGSGAPAQNNPNSQGPFDDQPQKQTKRILGILPNFRAVSADEKLPPQSVKEKFVTCTEDSFDYSAIFVPVVLAGYDLKVQATPEFHSGADGYARYLWHSAVDQTSENYMVEFVVPSITREDTRYYTLGRGGFMKRTGYALSRAVVTRSDSGSETFNFSEVVGSGMSAGISNLYYPSASRSVSSTGTQWGLDVAIDAASFWVKEFWPDINHRIFQNKSSAKP